MQTGNNGWSEVVFSQAAHSSLTSVWQQKLMSTCGTGTHAHAHMQNKEKQNRHRSKLWRHRKGIDGEGLSPWNFFSQSLHNEFIKLSDFKIAFLGIN